MTELKQQLRAQNDSEARKKLSEQLISEEEKLNNIWAQKAEACWMPQTYLYSAYKRKRAHAKLGQMIALVGLSCITAIVPDSASSGVRVSAL